MLLKLKKTISMKQLLFLFVAIVTISTSCSAQGGRKRASPHDTVSTKDITITYGRPYKKGRVIFGELEKFDNVWRLGADEATNITFNSDAKFGGEGIKKGTYTMFAIPGKSEWTIILNSQLGQWGAFGYEENKDKDVLKIKVPVTELPAVVEQLTIKILAGSITIEWDNTKVAIPYSM
jgi:hypothetical protein